MTKIFLFENYEVLYFIYLQKNLASNSQIVYWRNNLRTRTPFLRSLIFIVGKSVVLTSITELCQWQVMILHVLEQGKPNKNPVTRHLFIIFNMSNKKVLLSFIFDKYSMTSFWSSAIQSAAQFLVSSSCVDTIGYIKK